jgi:hypothetical protein
MSPQPIEGSGVDVAPQADEPPKRSRSPLATATVNLVAAALAVVLGPALVFGMLELANPPAPTAPPPLVAIGAQPDGPDDVDHANPPELATENGPGEDVTSQELSITSPADGTTVATRQVTVEGTDQASGWVSLAGTSHRARISRNGDWTMTVGLEPGENDLRFLGPGSDATRITLIYVADASSSAPAAPGASAPMAPTRPMEGD